MALLFEKCPPNYFSFSRFCISGAAAAVVRLLCSDTPLYYLPLTTGAFELSRDGLLWRDSPSLPGYCMHNE